MKKPLNLSEIFKKDPQLERLNSFKLMSYNELLRQPEWQKKRLEILNRDNFSCCICDSTTKQLQVHHTFYSKSLLPWEYPSRTLLTVCLDCHKNHYHNGKANKK